MGKNLPAARSYHLADGPKLDYLRERFDPQTRERYDLLATTSREILGRRLAKNSLDHQFADEINGLQVERDHTIINIERSGQQYRKEVRTPDGKGGEDVELIAIPVVANIEKKIASLKAEREKLASGKTSGG